MTDRDEALARVLFAVCFEADAEADLQRDPLAFARRFDVQEDDARAIAAAPARLSIYRRLVKNQIGGTFRAMVGDVAIEVDRFAPDLLDKCVTAYLASTPPASRHPREVSHALFATSRAVLQADARVPSWLVEAMDAELVAHEVEAAPDVEKDEPQADLALDRGLRFAPHVRLRTYRFRVQEDREIGATPAEGPVSLLVYRDSDFVVQWYELEAPVCAFLQSAFAGATLGDAMAKWTNAVAIADAAAQEALSATLSDLAERGVLLGAI